MLLKDDEYASLDKDAAGVPRIATLINRDKGDFVVATSKGVFKLASIELTPEQTKYLASLPLPSAISFADQNTLTIPPAAKQARPKPATSNTQGSMGRRY